MALPLSEISTTLVAAEIEEVSYDVGTLFCSEKVNQFGFNTNSSWIQIVVWGMNAVNRAKLSPLHPSYVDNPAYRGGYHLGAFKGYDHTWKTYTGSVTMTGEEYTEPLKIRINILPAAAKLEPFPEPIPAIDHTFKIEFARDAGDFGHGTATVVESSIVINYPYYEFDILTSNPPDFATNGKLNIGDKFYIKATHISSPLRRWWDAGYVGQVEFTVPNTAYTEVTSLQNRTFIALKQTSPTVFNNYLVKVDLFADLYTPKTVVVKSQISLSSDYTTDVYEKTESKYIARNTTPGTQTLVASLEFDYNATNIKNKTTVGQTVYGRLYIDGVLHLNFSTTVQSTMPL